jgi:hypothetical protein
MNIIRIFQEQLLSIGFFSRAQLSSLLLPILFFCCTSQPETVYKGLPSSHLDHGSDKILSDTIVYHPVRVDQNGAILPWFSKNAGQSYDDALKRVWNFWRNIETDSNGMKYYMNHQVWDAAHDKRGLGGDQLMMAISSWDLYYNYTGDQEIIDNMKYMADYYLDHSLSSSSDKWPHLPYPYNMDVEHGDYDGDMILGKGYLQPDKAGSFGYELIHLYKKTGDQQYLDAAVKIANTLASKVQPGDDENSPWPFKVHAETGKVGVLIENEVWYEGMDKDIEMSKKIKRSSYTTFYASTLGMFQELIELKQGDSVAYRKAFDVTLAWLKKYPAKTNKWGPFFEDIPRWSDTQINAITYAQFLLEHPELDPDWKTNVKSIFTWVHNELDNKQYQKYKVVPVDEQTAYRQPGNSHSARQAAAELLYWKKTGDTTYVRNAVRQLHWATYMVDFDGKNFYPTNAVWMTDGYGDYVRHYLRAMASAPELAPDDSDHLLSSSSIIQQINYNENRITYKTFDDNSVELLRLTSKPNEVFVDGKSLNESQSENTGWQWETMTKGGILRIFKQGSEVAIEK